MGKADAKRVMPGFSTEEPNGTVLMKGGKVRFFYDRHNWFDVELGGDSNRELKIRCSGIDCDSISIVPEVSNDVRIVPRTWNHSKNRWEVK